MAGIFPPAAVRITLSPFFKSNRYSPSFCRVNVALPAFTTGFAISVRRIHGSPARLLIRMKLVFPPFRTADTRKAPSVLRSLNCTSFHWEGTAGNTPVSYTHLRAHETGRNLVCRLLLEKKKKGRQMR